MKLIVEVELEANRNEIYQEVEGKFIEVICQRESNHEMMTLEVSLNVTLRKKELWVTRESCLCQEAHEYTFNREINSVKTMRGNFFHINEILHLFLHESSENGGLCYYMNQPRSVGMLRYKEINKLDFSKYRPFLKKSTYKRKGVFHTINLFLSTIINRYIMFSRSRFNFLQGLCSGYQVI